MWCRKWNMSKICRYQWMHWRKQNILILQLKIRCLTLKLLPARGREWLLFIKKKDSSCCSYPPHFTSAVTKPRPRYANHPMLRNHFEGNIEFPENVTWITPLCLSLNGYIYIYMCVFRVLYILTKGLHRSNPTQMGIWQTFHTMILRYQIPSRKLAYILGKAGKLKAPKALEGRR